MKTIFFVLQKNDADNLFVINAHGTKSEFRFGALQDATKLADEGYAQSRVNKRTRMRRICIELLPDNNLEKVFKIGSIVRGVVEYLILGGEPPPGFERSEGRRWGSWEYWPKGKLERFGVSIIPVAPSGVRDGVEALKSSGFVEM